MITMTQNAVRHVRELMQDAPDAGGKALRLYVQGGGCAGFEYGFSFDERKEDDSVAPQDGFDVVIDPMSAMYLAGMNVDYSEDLNGAGFKFTNPNSTGTCGCGKSFAV